MVTQQKALGFMLGSLDSNWYQLMRIMISNNNSKMPFGTCVGAFGLFLTQPSSVLVEKCYHY